MNILFRRLKKNKSLRIVSLIGLSVIFTCILLSYSYVKKELSYDRFNENADRIVRLSLQHGDRAVDGRIWNYYSWLDPILKQIPDIEDIVAIENIHTAVLEHQDKKQVINKFLFVNPNFFEVFSYKLLEGEKGKVLQLPESVVLSVSFARQLFGEESAIGKELSLSGRKVPDTNLIISGIFEDFPETSHIQADILIHKPNNTDGDWPYIYLLLKEETDIEILKNNIAQKIDESPTGLDAKLTPYLIPLTDIHLHSRVQRELSNNGNIYYIYLIVAANALLLIIVLFNLWLNAGLIFSSGRKYYQLLRLNGASSAIVIRDEIVFAFILGCVSILTGIFLSYTFASELYFSGNVTIFELVIISGIFLSLTIFISILPILTRISSTLFLNDESDLKALHSSFSNTKYMLVAQYAIVIFVVILAFGITKQMILIRDTQLGQQRKNILLMTEQPHEVKQRYELLKTELLKYPEIESVTASMQLPGDAILDGVFVKLEGQSDDEIKNIKVLIVGDDFLPFFDIKPIAGTSLNRSALSFAEEENMLFDFFEKKDKGENIPDNVLEEYIINEEALPFFGLSSAEEALGKKITIYHDALGYINGGTICGVVDNFTYTSVFEKRFPLLVFQRKFFLHCIMVRLDEHDLDKGLETFNRVWNEVNPDFPADYTFLEDTYNSLYRNELNAELLVLLFSLLCFLIADLGLIVFMAFIIKQKTKEIAIRKVNGAKASEIIKMLNKNFIPWLLLSFLVAVPFSYWAMQKWLDNFAYKATLPWWIFVLACLLVMTLSAISVSWQSWRAAKTNPINAIKKE